MTAFNVVRFGVKPGREQEFLNAHRNVQTDWPGLRKVNLVKSGPSIHSVTRLKISAVASASLIRCPVQLF
jgi:hypothetical protein